MMMLFLGGSAILTTPKDIFPNINIPVVTIIWQYTGLTPEEMEQRVTTYSEYTISTNASALPTTRYTPADVPSGLSSPITSGPRSAFSARGTRAAPRGLLSSLFQAVLATITARTIGVSRRSILLSAIDCG
jgi:AcrB/AcrD/AcrF family